MSEDPGKAALQTYSEALKAACQPLLAAGATQKLLAEGVGYSQSAVSRFLNGERIAKEGFIKGLERFAVLRGSPLADAVLEDLRRLRSEAERLGTTEARLRHAQEEITRLKADLAEKTQIAQRSQNAAVQEAMAGLRWHTDQELAVLEARLLELATELREERQQARAVQRERDALRDKVRDQERRLSDASELVREMNTDIDRQQEEIRLLRQEIKVLRGQVERLTKEKAVPGVSTQVTAKAVAAETSHSKQEGLPERKIKLPAADKQERPATRPAAKMAPTPPRPAPTRAGQQSAPLLLPLVPWNFAPALAVFTALMTVFVPVFVFLNGAAFAAACASEHGPRWWGITLLAVADSTFTLLGSGILFVLIRLALEALPKHEDALTNFLMAAGVAVVAAVLCDVGFVVKSVTFPPGLWWLHTFGISA